VDVAIACVRSARLLLDTGREALLVPLERARSERIAALEQELGRRETSPTPVKVRLVANHVGRASSA
jgi:hypothetical protein